MNKIFLAFLWVLLSTPAIGGPNSQYEKYSGKLLDSGYIGIMTWSTNPYCYYYRAGQYYPCGEKLGHIDIDIDLRFFRQRARDGKSTEALEVNLNGISNSYVGADYPLSGWLNRAPLFQRRYVAFLKSMKTNDINDTLTYGVHVPVPHEPGDGYHSFLFDVMIDKATKAKRISMAVKILEPNQYLGVVLRKSNGTDY